MNRLACSALTWVVAIACVGWPQVLRSHGPVTTTVLFDREIVRILNSHCVACHSEGSLAFPLSTYEQTWVRGRAMRMAVLQHHMPPWPAVAGYGQFLNDNSLTVRETQFVVSWVEGLGPRNTGSVFLNVASPGVAPQEVRATAHVGHWLLGEPDASLPLTAVPIDAGRTDFVQRFVIDLAAAPERLLRALEYMPGDRRVVRAATFSLESTGQWLGSWTPWYGFTKQPEGAATRLPARSRIVAEIHYRGANESVTDRGSLGLFFDGSQKTPLPTTSSPRLSSDLVLDATLVPPLVPPLVPALVPATRVLRTTARIAADTHIWALRPDVVAGLASIEISARAPNGGTEILLFARDPSVEWPTPYILKTPRLLRRGTELRVVAHARGITGAPRADSMRVIISRY